MASGDCGSGVGQDFVLDTAELRRSKHGRPEFVAIKRNPVEVLLDGVTGHYNIGAILRLCDAFLVERLIICGADVAPRNRRFLQAAAGTQRWVPWTIEANAESVVQLAKAGGQRIVVAELTANSIPPANVTPQNPTLLVLGSESHGVSKNVLAYADQAITIPMLGMANSLNVATAAAIVLYELLRSKVQQTTSPH